MHELMHNTELLRLAREINTAQETIEALAGQAIDRMRLTAQEAILQGQRLLQAKAQTKHGQWMDWLAAHCPTVSVRKADRYMAHARNPASLEELPKCCHLLMDKDSNGEAEETPARPASIEGIDRGARMVTYFLERNSPAKWNEPERQRLAEVFKPLAIVLYGENLFR